MRQLTTQFVIYEETLYRRSVDVMLLLCLDHAFVDRVMREVHAGVCRPHMGGHMLACKIMRIGYFWLTMETLLPVCLEISRVPDSWGPHSRTPFRVTCIEFIMAIFSMGYRHYWKDFAEVFQWSRVPPSRHRLLHQVGGGCLICEIDII